MSEVKVVARVKGLWKLAFLTFLFRHKSVNHTVHVHISDGKRVACVEPSFTHQPHMQTPPPAPPPSLTGQA